MNWTLERIKAANTAAGLFYFEPATMRFFKSVVSKVVHEGNGGIYLVTSEKGPGGKRKWTVRQFKPETGHVVTVGIFQQYDRPTDAHVAAQQLANGEK